MICQRNASSKQAVSTGVLLCGAALAGLLTAFAEEPSPDYNFSVRPILAQHCFRCHGQDAKQRKGKLRLDRRESAIEAGAINPGNLEKSELWERITTHDEDDIMPPLKEKRALSDAQKEILKRWIEAGAPYADHWAFVPPARREVPHIDDLPPIDSFIRSALMKKGLSPAAPASREDWLRRVTFDLTGFPPSLMEMDQFLADSSATAFERVVDRLLASPAFGERMAQDWLDVARYADTYGRHEDADCITWPYRDWVIRAFNENLSYDQFITWQTAGDLLPSPTRDQLVATCFNRLPQQSNEAGSNAEEFRIEQVADRVRTNGLAFLGLSMECARCHDHKYDPLTMRDYYQLSAMFNNIDELGLFSVYTGAVPPPSILIFKDEDEQRYRQVRERIARLEKEMKAMLPEARLRFAEWLRKHQPPMRPPEKEGFFTKVAGLFSMHAPLPRSKASAPLAHYAFESGWDTKELVNSANPAMPGEARSKTRKVHGRSGSGYDLSGDNIVKVLGMPEMKRSQPFSFGLWFNPKEHNKRGVLVHRTRSGIDSASRGFEIIIEDDTPEFALVHFSPGNEIRIRASKPLPLNEWTHIAATYDGSSRISGMKLYINGVEDKVTVMRDHLYRDIVYREEWGDDPGGKDGVSDALGVVIGGRHNDASCKDSCVDEFFFYDRELTSQEVAQWALLPESRSPDEWFTWYLRERDGPWETLQKQLDVAREEENELSGKAVDLMVMQEWSGPRRKTHVLNRGQFNQPREEVSPGTPASLPPMPEGSPQNRLGLAQWLTSPGNPLVSRVAVNRFWQTFFGRGIVGTPEDFGTQGQLPTHPELLDWLALHFMDTGWDVKNLCREIVLSATYRQDGEPADRTLLKDDPENRLLAHGPRQRLSAEQVRDLTLFASGLVDRTVGGPSVKPYQPAGLWEESGTQHTYDQDHGPSLYRRSLYTFWRRTMPPPSMTIFDAPSREFCKVRRERTATPMQSLVLMNDPQFVEASRNLAVNLVQRFPSDTGARARAALRLLTSRDPAPGQLGMLAGYLNDERSRLEADSSAVTPLLKQNGEKPLGPEFCNADVAATTLMVRLLLGFSETTMKP